MRKLAVVLAVFLAAFSCSPEEQTETILEATGCECVWVTYDNLNYKIQPMENLTILQRFEDASNNGKFTMDE